MGYHNLPLYGEDLGSAIESAEKALAVIKSNKFDNEDLLKLSDTLEAVIDAIEEYVNKD